MVCSSTSNSFGLSRYLGRPQLVQKKNANEYLGPLLLRFSNNLESHFIQPYVNRFNFLEPNFKSTKLEISYIV